MPYAKLGRPLSVVRMWHLKCDAMMVSFVKYRLSMSMLHFVYCVVVFPVRGLKLYQYHVRGFGSKQQGCGLVCLQVFGVFSSVSSVCAVC